MELLRDIGFLLSRGSGRAIRLTNAHLEPLGLRVRQYSVLSVAAEPGGVTQRGVGELLGLDPSQVVALVDELQGRGLVERHPDPRDRRTNRVTATAAGKALNRRALRAVDAAGAEYLALLDEPRRALLRELLTEVALPDGIEARLTGRRDVAS